MQLTCYLTPLRSGVESLNLRLETDLAETVHEVNFYVPKFALAIISHFTTTSTRRAQFAQAGQDAVLRPENAPGLAFEKDCHFWDGESV